MILKLLVAASFGGAATVSTPIATQEVAPAVVPAFARAAAAAAPDTAPQPPTGSSPGQVLPPLDADWRFITPNRNLTREETVWHMRVALNVAALGCRGGEQRIVAGYNAMLASKKAELVAAQASVDQIYRARFAAEWQSKSDDSMTKLYNFFAQPPAQTNFCTAAEQILGEVATVAPSAFADFAEGALPRLEAPFLAFYARYAHYRMDLAAWNMRKGSGVMLASSVGAVDPVSLVAQTIAADATTSNAASVAAVVQPAASATSTHPATPVASSVPAVGTPQAAPVPAIVAADAVAQTAATPARSDSTGD